MAMSAPARARASAIAFPIRRDPPVTRAARPARLMRVGGRTDPRLAFRNAKTGDGEAGRSGRPALAAPARRFTPRAAGRRRTDGSNSDAVRSARQVSPGRLSVEPGDAGRT